ncbi:MAG: hypothetical protein H7831_17710, partial [Magnetococcus sp. WYHC-3]
EETAKVKLAQARVLIAAGAFDIAIAKVDEVIHEKGPSFGFPFHWAVDLKGDALTGANRLADALAVRKERLAQIEAVAAPDEVGAATMGVRFQIAQLEQRIAAGKSGGAQ